MFGLPEAIVPQLYPADGSMKTLSSGLVESLSPVNVDDSDVQYS